MPSMGHMNAVSPVTLTGKLVRLEPLSMDHMDGLAEASADGDVWRIWYTSIPKPEDMAAEIERRLGLLAKGSMVPFTARRVADGQVLGMTTYMNIDQDLPRVEIGSTWNRASAHGSGTNAESKLLLLEHAFEVLGCPAVEFRTSWFNHQSRAAIERLGAKMDGVLRRHARTADGSLRDTVVYSILDSEWPQVRMNLEYRLAQRRSAMP